MLQIKFMSTSCHVVLSWMPQHTYDDINIGSDNGLVLSGNKLLPEPMLCWLGSMLPFGVSRPHPVKHYLLVVIKQGKSEGFESCDWPIVWKRPIWVKIGDVLYRVTLKFDGWPWKTIGHLSFAVSSCVQHFIAIGEFKLELQSGNAEFESNSTIFRAVWPWNLTDDLEK